MVAETKRYLTRQTDRTQTIMIFMIDLNNHAFYQPKP